MSRARRLAEIAKANQPAFTSESGDHWWLADPSVKPEPAPLPPHIEEPAPVAAVSAVALNGTAPAPQTGVHIDSLYAAEAEAVAAYEFIASPATENGIGSSRSGTEPTAAMAPAAEAGSPIDSLHAAEAPPVAAYEFTSSPALKNEAESSRNGAEPAAAALPQPEPTEASSGTASRLGALKEKFLWLGRRNRGERD